MNSKQRITVKQIRLVQTAVRAAGLRSKNDDGRYRLLLGQYVQSNGGRVVSCKQLSNFQLDDRLAIWESMGWRYPGKPENFCREKVANQSRSQLASYAQTEGIRHLAGDLGWKDHQLAGMIERMTHGNASSVVDLTPGQGHIMIEALKSMLSRKTGKTYPTLKDVESDMKGVARDGKKKAG